MTYPQAKLQEARSLYRKIMDAIRDEQIIFVLGRIKESKKSIDIDIGWHEAYVALIDIRHDVLRASLEECLHHLKPRWDHRQILPCTQRIMSLISVRQLCEFMQVVWERSYWLEKEFDHDEDIEDLDKILTKKRRK